MLLYLAGGNDGLNTIVPAGAADYAAYADARKTIRRIQGPSAGADVGSRPLAGFAGRHLAFSNVMVSTGGGGDNGGAAGLDTLYGDGSGGPGSDLAVMPAVDAKTYSLSHFDNSDIWFKASYDLNVKTGWLGRWIDEYGVGDNPLQAVSIDTALSKSIRTARKPVCAIPSLASLGFNMNAPGGPGTVNVNAQMQALTGVPFVAGNAYLERTRGTYAVAVATHQRLGDGPDYVPGSGYPSTATLSTRLKLAAHLLAAGLGTRIITIHWGGFDTHSGQRVSQDAQLTELSRALGAFRFRPAGTRHRAARLRAGLLGVRPPLQRERLGRHDHGAGGLMMAMGSGVRGGLASEWPGCQPKDLVPDNAANGNLRVPTDYRSVYRSVVEEWLGGDPDLVVGGGAIAGLVRGDVLAGRALFK